MDALDERAKVARYLESRTIAFGAEIAFEALGKRYGEMDRTAWARLAGYVLAAGFRKGRVGGHPVFLKPEPARELPL